MIIGIDEEKVLLVDLMLHPNLPADDPKEFSLSEFRKIDVSTIELTYRLSYEKKPHVLVIIVCNNLHYGRYV